MNSNSLFTTVLRNFQCALAERINERISRLQYSHRRNLGYWPTMYIISDAMMALWCLPFFTSQRPRSSYSEVVRWMSVSEQIITLITVTRKRFSSSSLMAPDMDPMAQHSVLRFFHDHSVPLTCFVSLSVIIRSVSM